MIYQNIFLPKKNNMILFEKNTLNSESFFVLSKNVYTYVIHYLNMYYELIFYLRVLSEYNMITPLP